MTERIENSGDAGTNTHYRTLAEAIGPPDSGRGSGGGNPVITVDVGVQVDVSTGKIIFQTDRLTPSRAYSSV